MVRRKIGLKLVLDLDEGRLGFDHDGPANAVTPLFAAVPAGLDLKYRKYNVCYFARIYYLGARYYCASASMK